MTATWAELFDRAAEHDVTLEDVRTAADEWATTAEAKESTDDA